MTKQSGTPAALLKTFMRVMLGIVDECVHALFQNRVFDPIDIAFNAFAAGLV